MHQFAGVLFHMNFGKADGKRRAVFLCQMQRAALADGNAALGNLIPFGQIRIMIIFTIHIADPRHIAAQSQPHFGGIVHNGTVHHRQASRQPQAHRAAVGIFFAAEYVFTIAENLGFGGQFHMNFQPDYGFEFHFAPPFWHTGRIMDWPKFC